MFRSISCLYWSSFLQQAWPLEQEGDPEHMPTPSTPGNFLGSLCLGPLTLIFIHLEAIINICVLQRKVPNALEAFGTHQTPLYIYVFCSSVDVDTRRHCCCCYLVPMYFMWMQLCMGQRGTSGVGFPPGLFPVLVGTVQSSPLTLCKRFYSKISLHTGIISF